MLGRVPIHREPVQGIQLTRSSDTRKADHWRSNALDGIEFSDDAVLDALKELTKSQHKVLNLTLTIVTSKSLKKSNGFI